MIEIKDKYGHLVAVVSEQVFPLQVTAENSSDTHKVYAKFTAVKSDEGERTEIKSMNMGR